MSSSLAIIPCSVSVTTTVFEKTTPNFSPSLSLVGQKPFLTASPSTSLRGIGLSHHVFVHFIGPVPLQEGEGQEELLGSPHRRQLLHASLPRTPRRLCR